MNTFDLTGKVDVDLTSLSGRMSAAEKSVASLHKRFEGLASSTQTMTKGVQQFAQANQQMGAAVQQTDVRTRSLQQTLRDSTVAILGNNVAALALGNTLGAVVASAIMATVAALAQSIRQFAELQNTLALIPAVGSEAANSLRLIEEVAASSSSSVQQLGQRYQAMLQQFQGTRLTLEQVNNLFRDQERALNAIQQVTLGGATSKLLDEVGRTVLAFDQMLGISNLIIGALELVGSVLERIRALMNSIRGTTEATGDAIMSFGVNIADSSELLKLEQFRLQGILRIIEAAKTSAQGYNGALGDEATIRDQLARIATRLLQLEADRVAMATRFTAINDRVTEQLQLQIANMRRAPIQQEIMNRMLQTELQFRAQNVALSEQQRAALLAMTTQAALASQFQGLRDSLMTQEALEMQSFARRTEMLTQFLQTGLIQRQEFDALYEAEFHRSQTAMTQMALNASAMQLQAMQSAGQQLVTVLQSFTGKSRAAAVAAIAVNTALQISAAIQNTAAAMTRALAELGPIAGPPAAASIGAWGSAQVALIAAAGALQGAGALKTTKPAIGGGGPGSVDTGGAAGAAGSAPITIVIEPLDPNAILTGQQVNDLIGVINEKARNGHVVIANKVI